MLANRSEHGPGIGHRQNGVPSVAVFEMVPRPPCENSPHWLSLTWAIRFTQKSPVDCDVSLARHWPVLCFNRRAAVDSCAQASIQAKQTARKFRVTAMTLSKGGAQEQGEEAVRVSGLHIPIDEPGPCSALGWPSPELSEVSDERFKKPPTVPTGPSEAPGAVLSVNKGP